MRVQLISVPEVRVFLNYYRRDCLGGPFSDIRNNAPFVAPFFNPEQLIRLLSPPLEYSQRKMIMIWGPLWMLTLILALTGVFIYYTIIEIEYYVYYTVQVVYGCSCGVIVLLYLTWFFCWQNKFVQRLQAYLNDLNRGELAPYGLQLFFNGECMTRYRGGILLIRRVVNEMSTMPSPDRTYMTQ